MLDDPTPLPEDPEELRAFTARLLAEVKAQAILIEKLRHQLAGHRAHRFGASSETAEQLQLALETSEIAAAAMTARLRLPDVEEKGQPKRRPIPEDIPRMEVELSIATDACADCGGKLRRIGEDVTEELEYVPRFIVNRIVRPRLTCAGCERFVQAALPSRPRLVELGISLVAVGLENAAGPVEVLADVLFLPVRGESVDGPGRRRSRPGSLIADIGPDPALPDPLSEALVPQGPVQHPDRGVIGMEQVADHDRGLDPVAQGFEHLHGVSAPVDQRAVGNVRAHAREDLANGLAFHKDGRLFVADYRNGIMVYDPASGRIAPFLQRHNLERLRAVNDLTFSSSGDLFFTDQGLTGLHDPTGRVFRVRSDGTVDLLLNNVPSPNGLVVSPDNTTLYVAVTRANAVWRVPLMPNGGVAKVGLFVQLSGGGGPDGLAIDREGGLAICHIGLGAVWLMTPRGEPALRIDSPAGHHTTNAAYARNGGQQIYTNRPMR